MTRGKRRERERPQGTKPAESKSTEHPRLTKCSRGRQGVVEGLSLSYSKEKGGGELSVLFKVGG